jgi:hypothetical protein
MPGEVCAVMQNANNLNFARRGMAIDQKMPRRLDVWLRRSGPAEGNMVGADGWG